MPRDRANIRTNIWADSNWRALSKGAQHLYLLLLSHPGLNYAGVCDWRPGRIARMTEGETIASVTRDADELERAAFVIRDDETEEICIRSFVKHDGLMKQPLLAVSMANAYGDTASPQIRRVIAWEVQKLNGREPGLAAWQKPAVQTVLAEPAFDLTTHRTRDPDEDATDELTPGLTPDVGPSPGQSQAVATTTATTTATEEPLSPAFATDQGVLIPPGWAPNERHRDKARLTHLDVDYQAQRFIQNAHQKARRLKNWDTGFTNWLRKAAEFAQQNTPRQPVTSVAPRRPTAVQRNLERYRQKYGDTNDGPTADRAALDPSFGDRRQADRG